MQVRSNLKLVYAEFGDNCSKPWVLMAQDFVNKATSCTWTVSSHVNRVNTSTRQVWFREQLIICCLDVGIIMAQFP